MYPKHCRSLPGRVSRIQVLGFTLIEILVVMGLIAILASVVLVAINPARQFAQARNAQRAANVHALLNAAGARIAEHRGLFTSEDCPQALPAAPMVMATEQYDIRPCLVPTYLSELPIDPEKGRNDCQTIACDGPDESYNTHYTITQTASSSRITVCAPEAEESALEGSKSYCLMR